MNKIAILCNSKYFSSYANRIKSTLEAEKVQVEIIFSDTVNLSNENTFDFDLIYSRLSGLKWNYELFSQIAINGTKIIPNIESWKNIQNKYISTVVSRKFGIKTPKTYLISTHPNFYKENLENTKELSYPFILKPLYSALGGNFCFKIENKKDFQHYLGELFKCHCEEKDLIGTYDYGIIQEFIKFQKLIRSLIIDGKTICCGYVTPINSWKCSVCTNPNIQSYEISPTLEQFNMEIFEAFKGEIMIIDIFETDKGYVFNECNTACGLFNLEKVSGINIAEIIADYLVKKLGE